MFQMCHSFPHNIANLIFFSKCVLRVLEMHALSRDLTFINFWGWASLGACNGGTRWILEQLWYEMGSSKLFLG